MSDQNESIEADAMHGDELDDRKPAARSVKVSNENESIESDALHGEELDDRKPAARRIHRDAKESGDVNCPETSDGKVATRRITPDKGTNNSANVEECHPSRTAHIRKSTKAAMADGSATVDTPLSNAATRPRKKQERSQADTLSGN